MKEIQEEFKRVKKVTCSEKKPQNPPLLQVVCEFLCRQCVALQCSSFYQCPTVSCAKRNYGKIKPNAGWEQLKAAELRSPGVII